MFTYRTKGTCSSAIRFDVADGVLQHVEFEGGCNGNLNGIGRLTAGMKVDEVIQRLKGISCGAKETSCPDQLARALEEWQAEH
jgi:uncharacterized protein (TIGR03905 family)